MHLEKINPTLNEYRCYQIELTHSLFGGLIVDGADWKGEPPPCRLVSVKEGGQGCGAAIFK